MNYLKDLVAPIAFNKFSYVAVLCWITYGVILFGIFAGMENSDSFRCEAKTEETDLVQGKCSDQYNKQYNKSGIPVYGFVIANFSLIVIVCVIYSQVVKSRLRKVAHRQRADAEGQNRPKRRKLFVAYFCQLATRFAIGIIFIVLQTQVLYPDNFPGYFHCQIAAASDAANASSTSNIDCHNQQATKKTAWMNAVTVGNGMLALIVLIEIIFILALRVKKGNEFLEDSQFLAAFLPIQESKEEQYTHDEYLESLKKNITENTEEPPDLKALFQVPHSEGKRSKDLRLDQIYTNLVLLPDRTQYDFTGNRQEQLKVYPMSMENTQRVSREKIVDAENQKILIVGRPGIGKTCFLTKWIRDWATKSGKALSDFDSVFFLKFRLLNDKGELSLRDLLSESQYSDPERFSDQVWNHVCTNPKRVLIIFDGLDEYLHRSSIANQSVCESGEKRMSVSALFYNLVEGKLLPGASVLTTTRPTAVEDVKYLHFVKTIEIHGFASEQVKEYVENFAKRTAQGVADAGKKMWAHIETNMNIFSLCYIPMNCLIICSCLLQSLKFNEEMGLTGLPTRLTEIYQIAMKFFFFRHGKQYRDKDPGQEDIRSNDLPPELEKEIKPLAKLAFDGLTQKRLIFGQREVPKHLVESALFHRLPNRQVGPLTVEAQYCFIHLTMQEFLAAKHITETMKGEELRRFVADHIKNGEWQLVLQFVAGLLGEDSINAFTDLLPKTTEEKDKRGLMNDYSLEGRTVTCWPRHSRGEIHVSLEGHTVTSWPTHREEDLAVTLIKCIYETNESGSVVQSKLEEIGFNAVDFRYILWPRTC